jgi:uncharacterized Zn finger protein/superfamily II DNA or RNA helicase
MYRKGRRSRGWFNQPAKKAIPPESGIRGGGKYGATWWGQQWLQAFNHISDSNRLPRGRTYANNGSVRDIRINGSAITADVQGSYLYHVSVTIPKFSQTQQQTILHIVQKRPELLARLLNRELPPELNDLCTAKGVKLFPDNWKSFEANCTCPDWALPCKHLAAVIYLIANEIDKNPFLVFDLHGFDLPKALAQNGLYAQGQGHQITALHTLRRPMDAQPTAAFVFDPAIMDAFDLSRIPECKDNLLTILPDNPVFFPSGNFKSLLQKALTAAAKQAGVPPLNAPGLPANDRTYRLAEVVECTLNAQGQPLHFGAWDADENELFQTSQFDQWTHWLAGVPAGQLPNLPSDLRAHWMAWRFATALACKGAVVPQLLDIGDQHFFIRWLPALLNPEVAVLFRSFEAQLPPYVVNIQVPNSTALLLPVENDRALTLLSIYLNHYMQASQVVSQHAIDQQVVDLFFGGKVAFFSKFEQRTYPDAIGAWLDRFFITVKGMVPMLEISEKAPDGFAVGLAVEDKSDPLKAPIPLQKLLKDDAYAGFRMDILRDLSTLGSFFPGINTLLADKGEKPLFYPASDFAGILLQTLPIIRLFGIRVLVPKSLSRLLRPRVSLSLSEPEGKVLTGVGMSLTQMLSYKWQVALGDHLISPESFLEMLSNSKGLVKVRDEYVYFDEKETKALSAKLAVPPSITGPQLLQTALAESYEGAPITMSDGLRKRIQKLLTVDLVPLPTGLKATLRPYQHRGFSWLCKNAQIGFGSILADDMGLGKTLQVITTLLHLKEKGEVGSDHPALAILPTTLITNWEREIARFAPSLRTAVYHGPARQMAQIQNADLVLTSYGVARSDAAKLEKYPWQVLIIDEAQNIKNPSTEQSKAIKKIQAPIRIALSGTPVENRLSEYWSVFDFTNKGFLGSSKTFRDEFAIPIEGERDQYTLRKFQKITRPFVLRRLKTDKSIISDLPDKIEQNQFCTLSPEQAALYQSVVDKTLDKIERTTGIERRGLVLNLIMTLKQICNHPAQYLKKGPAVPEHSGKCPLLLDLLEQAIENDEKTLIFTQFREMGELLIPMVQNRLGVEPDFLHGGVSRKGRDTMIQDFQTKSSHPVLLLSLKAGGTGLNLTKASQVIHFDLWWNPAVEAQATDRAYRIGQHRNVQVHRFITFKTFEERIDAMIQQKKELANLTVSSGETWIGELSNRELREVFQYTG